MKGTIHRTTKLLSRLAGSLMLGMLVLGCHPNVSSKDTTPPAEVTELKPIPGNGKISLSWVNPADADLHQVEISATPAAGTLANPVYLSAEKGKAMSFTAEGLTNGTAYTFTVKTLDKALKSSTGVTTEAVKPMDTSDKTPPAEVTDLKADVKGSAVLLSWKNPADDDLYQVEITVSPQAGSLAHPVYLKAQKGATGSFSVESLANGTEYTFTVRTIDTALHKSTGATVKKTIQQGENTSVAYSDLDGYLSNTASSTGINYITVTGLTPDLVTGKNWYEGYRVPSPLGKILKAHSDKRVALTLPSVSALGDNAFVDCLSLTSVTMPEGIASIGNGAFKSCTGLTSITIPNTVTDIGTEAFTDCTSLKSISIPDTVRYMSNEVFKNCTALETVHLSTEINRIREEMFYNCVNLKTITIPNKVSHIDARAFQGCTSLTSLTVDSSNTKYGSADNMIYTKDTNSLVCVAPGLAGSVTIPANVQAIGDEAFSGCTKLESVTIPNGITKIERNTFRGCTGLTTISLPASISQLVDNPFSGCTNLTTLTVDSSNTKYGSADNMIYTKDTNRLVCVAPGLAGSVTVPANIQTIGNEAFSGCTKLESVTMQDGVQSIGYRAFAYCQNLTCITIPKTVTYIGKWGFGESPNAEIVLAEGISSTTIYIEPEAFGSGDREETLCKKVKIKDDTNYDDLKKKVVASRYPENRIEKY